MTLTKTKTALLGATALSMATAAMPAMAQEGEAVAERDVIIVTAQRVEQDIQDVPISITVFDQEKLANNNILNAKDIATFTPGVYAQTRYGNDTTTYTVRGFAQEQRTTATVGTYFAEVVAPRGNGISQGGDGASPGALFDLENVQVLKGPQGTLFGRNTTGGAVLLVPVKPRDEFEGYVEGTVGNLNRWRVQGVINLPVSDTFRLRLGADRHKRDGYIKNIGLPAKHDDDMGSIDIMALRASAVWDITPDIENYTIVSYSESKSSGSIPLIKVDPNDDLSGRAFSGLVGIQKANEDAAGGFWTGTNSNPLGESYFEEFRVINRTTIDLNDSLTLTNLFGYAELKGTNAVDAFGLNAAIAGAGDQQQHWFSFVPISANPDYGSYTANQRSIVEELRLSGDSGRLQWQAGLYYEKSSPMDFTGTFTPAAARCTDLLTFRCANSSGGTINANKITFETIAAYAQGTYDITDQLALTAGIRWTEDKTKALFSYGRVRFDSANNWANNTFECAFPGVADNPDGSRIVVPNTFENRQTLCLGSDKTKTSAPTWVVNLQYKPNEDVMVYAKWARGYRQGSLVTAAPPGLQSYDEEELDLYEIGAKASWYGAVPGRFNIAAFYNDFRGQQIQAGISTPDLSVQTTTIINADKSETYGIEADLMIEPVEGFTLEAAYSYNKTKLKAATFPDLSDLGYDVRELELGGAIPLSVPHAFNATATWTLPLDESVGEVTLSGSVVHMSSFRAVADAPDPVLGQFTGRGILPKRTFGNANLTWKGVGGGPVDATLYVTNITNEKMYTHINEQSNRGFVAYSVDEQRQYGIRVKYRFGALGN